MSIVAIGLLAYLFLSAIATLLCWSLCVVAARADRSQRMAAAHDEEKVSK